MLTCHCWPAACSGARMRRACASITAIASGGLLGDNHRHAALDDGGLLAGDRRQRVAEEFGVVHADRRDHARQRLFDRVGGVEPPAEADFQQQRIGRILREHAERGRGLDLEHRDRRAVIGLFAALQRIPQFVIADEHAATGAAEAKHSLSRTR